jgi:hypothetical protein
VFRFGTLSLRYPFSHLRLRSDAPRVTLTHPEKSYKIANLAIRRCSWRSTRTGTSITPTATVRDRVKAQKTAGKPIEAVVASKPTADFDQAWGTENVPADLFVTVVYTTL